MGQHLKDHWNQSCPCQSELLLNQCCGPKIEDRTKAATAEELMRSRYSAFVLQEIDYIVETFHPETRHKAVRQDIADWSQNSHWEGFHLISTKDGAENDDEGEVEFVVRYQARGKAHVHRECSRFVKNEGSWFFHSGEQQDITYRRTSPKVGRNDPCPCNSGKKFKKCCHTLLKTNAEQISGR